MPSVQRAHEAFEDQDVIVLTISIDGTGMEVVKPYITTHQYTMPTAIDPSMDVARQFGVRAVPTTYVIDRQGTITAGGFGPVDFDRPEFRSFIEALVAQPQKS